MSFTSDPQRKLVMAILNGGLERAKNALGSTLSAVTMRSVRAKVAARLAESNPQELALHLLKSQGERFGISFTKPEQIPSVYAKMQLALGAKSGTGGAFVYEHLPAKMQLANEMVKNAYSLNVVGQHLGIQGAEHITPRVMSAAFDQNPLHGIARLAKEELTDAVVHKFNTLPDQGGMSILKRTRDMEPVDLEHHLQKPLDNVFRQVSLAGTKEIKARIKPLVRKLKSKIFGVDHGTGSFGNKFIELPAKDYATEHHGYNVQKGIFEPIEDRIDTITIDDRLRRAVKSRIRNRYQDKLHTQNRAYHTAKDILERRKR